MAINITSAQADYKFAMNNYNKYWQQARSCEDQEKLDAFKDLRKHFQNHPWHIKWGPNTITNPKTLLKMLSEDGRFCDMTNFEKEWGDKIYYSSYSNTPDDKVGIWIADALRRVFLICEAYRKEEITGEASGEMTGNIPEKVMNAILHYGTIELNRSNKKPRFHASCFAIPVAASNVYFSMLEQMDQVEQGIIKSDEKTAKACTMLKALALESWTQPLRKDETDQNVVSIERFRGHVWWVGGNALAYRPLLQTAVMFSSAPMVDVLSQVCHNCISCTSQTTFEEAFWTEGFTADGAGWGHGMQCLIWGYPIDGTSNALNMLSLLEDTPWEEPLNKTNIKALMNFFRGGSWYWHKGWRLPGLDRNSYRAELKPYEIAYSKMLDKVIEEWSSSFTKAEIQELKQLRKECKAFDITMSKTKDGLYHGTRWFFNNDDFIKRTENYHAYLNMASLRCDGLESAPQADKYNFTCTDGATLFQREGNEYFKIMGGWDVTFYPGVTSRTGMSKLTPVTNWRGYCSKYNFAGASHDSKANAVAALVFDKMDGNLKKSKTAQDGHTDDHAENKVLYNVEAYKSWFFIGDYMIALGAGITNKDPEQEGNIVTTIDQTALETGVNLGSKKLDKGLYSITLDSDDKSPIWISQKDKFSYCLLPSQENDKAYVSLETVPTDWIKMNKENKACINDLPKEVDILKIWIDHGRKPVDANYSYAVWLGGNKLPSKLPFKVLRNDKKIQAIASNDLIQAVFYPTDIESVKLKTFYGGKSATATCGPTNGELKTDSLKSDLGEISVSYPCTLMLDRKAKILYVTDATMNSNLKTITVTIDGKKHEVTMPNGDHCSDTASLKL